LSSAEKNISKMKMGEASEGAGVTSLRVPTNIGAPTLTCALVLSSSRKTFKSKSSTWF